MNLINLWLVCLIEFFSYNGIVIRSSYLDRFLITAASKATKTDATVDATTVAAYI